LSLRNSKPWFLQQNSWDSSGSITPKYGIY
jgi:hypothetical protein